MAVALTTYQDALAFLFARTTGASKLGLERTRALLSRLGDPHRGVPTFHIAGTNGKGSVVATLETLLRARGLRVARYTSPHLVDFRERILVDGRPIPAADVVAFIERWTPEVERIGATFFEATTALAFDHFARAGADVSLIETGLGGRLDATNVVEPLAAGVTSIGLDHVEYLGHSLEGIAAEKAGIFKPGAGAAIGETDLHLRRLLAGHAERAGASPVRVVADEWTVSDVRVEPDGTRFRLATEEGACELRTALVGRHQAQNAALALALLAAAGERWAVPLEQAARLLPAVRLPGRFQQVGRYVFDVAHNPDGAAVVAQTLAAVRPARPVAVLLTVLRDKDWRGMMTALAPAIDHFVLTCAPTAPASRAWDPAEAAAFAEARGWSAETERDFARALARAEAAGATVLVTGSFHTVGDAMASLQVAPLGG